MNPRNPKHEAIANVAGEIVGLLFSIVFLFLSHLWLFKPVMGFTMWNTIALFMACYVASSFFRPIRVRNIDK